MNEKISDQTEVRLDKLHQLIQLGINPYSNDFKPKHLISETIKAYGDSSKDELGELNKQFIFAGRITSNPSRA